MNPELKEVFNTGVKYCLDDKNDQIDKGIDMLLSIADGNAEVCYTLARIYLGKKNDAENAIRFYRKAAEDNYLLAVQDLGALHQLGRGVPKDIDKAIEYYKLCGNAISFYSIGKIYHMGEDVTQNFEEAAKWFKLSADKEYSDACGMLGTMYYNGEHFDKNLHMALYYFEKCYDYGNKSIALEIGNTYNSCNNILPDDEMAFEWYSKGSDDGVADCSYVLAELYRNGNGVVSIDEVKALEFYELSGKQGLSSGYLQAGLLYINGTTISKNYIKAEEYLYKALSLGNPTAPKAIEYLILLKEKSGISVRRENNQAYSGARIYDSGFTGLTEVERHYEEQKRIEDEHRREMLHAAAAVSSDTTFSYLDVDAGVVLNENMKIVSLIDADTGIILSDNDIAFYDKDTHTTYSHKNGLVHYDSDMKASYNYSDGKITWHDGDIAIKYD